MDSEEANDADTQDFIKHVHDKENGETSKYVSFSTVMQTKGGGGPIKFAKKSKIYKIAWEALQELEANGDIKIYTAEDVRDSIKNHKKKKYRNFGDSV